MIELRHLRYFVAVAEEGHVTRAAERLGMQQPPLSQQIKALEQELGVPLLRRLPRGVQPTESGLVLLAEARAILAQLDRALETVRRTGRGEQGRIAVGFTSSAAFHPFVSAAIRGFREAAPQVEMAMEESSTGELVEALRLGRLDAAFIRSPVGDAAGLAVEPLLDEPMVAAVPIGHPLAIGKAPIPLSALAEEAFVLYRRPSGPGLYDSIIAACRAAGFSPRIAQEAPRLVSTLSLVEAGLGVSIVPASMARLDTGGVAYLPLAGRPPLAAPLHLARRDAEPLGATRRFMEHVRRMAEGES
ncbi:LysR family transcriptional regulator [Inquilinus limosus]|uniref:LysR family transcriptional regulator n=1 Tax=Inquilinus limosus TaxID=171674 RepID=UPI0004067C55|nr:LysR family transcriptional regulator [Inquilinus limosus]